MAKPTTLTQGTVGFVVLGALIAGIGAWFVVSERLADFRQEALTEAVSARGRGVQFDLARTLHSEWQNAQVIAREIAQRDDIAVRSSLDLVVGDNSRVSWAGIARLDGVVTHASGGLLEGQNVSTRPWFQRGLEGDFAGDVHEALLLAELLPSQDGATRRFLDLATPIRDSDGQVTGVLGLHLDQSWARDYLARTAENLEIEAFLVDREGQIVIGGANEGESLDLRSMRAATAGASVTGFESWPDGQSYFTTVIPDFAYDDLPPFGWSLVARIGDDAIVAMSERSQVNILLFLIGFGTLLAAMTFLFVQLFVAPFRATAASAEAVLRGEDVYPHEARMPAEAVTFSAAVARLQAATRRKSA